MNRLNRRIASVHERKRVADLNTYRERAWHLVTITKPGEDRDIHHEEVIEWLVANATGGYRLKDCGWNKTKLFFEDETDATLFKVWVAGR